MIRITPFRADDIEQLEASQLASAQLAMTDPRPLARHYAALGHAFAARDAGGRIVFCGGAARNHDGYATLWALYAQNIKPATAARLLRATRQFLDGLHEFARVDAMVEASHPVAIKWAQRCGLTFEARLARAAIDGGDLLIFRKDWA